MNAEEPEPQDSDRWPGLTPHGAAIIDRMRDHPDAPIWRKASGHRLLPEEWPIARAFEDTVRTAAVEPVVDPAPAWLDGFLQHALSQVPAYRCHGARPTDFRALPTTSRADLSRDIAQFVPDDLPLDRLINFTTSGTTGHPLLIASHPLVAARYRAYHERALRRFGIELRASRGAVGVLLIGWQQQCFTYVSVTPTRDQSGLAKINLHTDDWYHPDDRAAWLDAMQAEVYSGDPLSFAELLKLPTVHRPRALLSTSMSLLPGLRLELEKRFQAPVLDLYSMNEAGPIAVFDPTLDGHVLLQDRLIVEILDEYGQSVADGERGEITLTGGFNFCMPLLRYRTGDHAALVRHDDGSESGTCWLLKDLSGRPPVRFRRADGSLFNNVELTHALKPMGLAQWQIRQFADGRVVARLHGCAPAMQQVVLALLQQRFGPGILIEIRIENGLEGKLVQYLAEME